MFRGQLACTGGGDAGGQRQEAGMPLVCQDCVSGRGGVGRALEGRLQRPKVQAWHALRVPPLQLPSQQSCGRVTQHGAVDGSRAHSRST